ncbi:putative inactive tRNA-specific adenosine deaminase-like protein 3 isoform X3 [Tubulanus polymorphus]|uniref:putative inactive tRNA-specific adenosine deaminase-like protein 3 isoform X3 n=1 Tax=Tubulanus polymorphus TaxID=672921 RepID=UPI003DA655E7
MAGPPLKKLKGDMPALTATSNHTVVIGSTDDDSDLPSSTENNVTLMLPPKPILADEISEDVELAKAYTCTVNDAKSLSKLVKYLSCEFPLGKIGHLKRVKKAKDIIAELGLLKIVHVPMKPPITRTQFENCSKYWPTSFHEDKVLEKIIRCESFTELELKRIGNHMQLAIDVSQHAEGKQLGIGAVVVDPSCDEVIAVATDLRHENILHHCTMVAIDLVARSQGGGAYNDITIGKYIPEIKNVFVVCVQKYWHFMCYLVLSDKPLHYRPPLSADYDVSSKDDSLPYLCTSYDLYITREPCAMCSMALTHSRINRVFYHSSVAHGALGSRYKIHCQKGLNHHYKVFQTFSNKECERS